MKNFRILGIVLALAAAVSGCGKCGSCGNDSGKKAFCPPNCDKPCCKGTGKSCPPGTTCK